MRPESTLPDPAGRMSTRTSGLALSEGMVPVASALHALQVSLERVATLTEQSMHTDQEGGDPIQASSIFSLCQELEARCLDLLQAPTTSKLEQGFVALLLRVVPDFAYLSEQFQSILPLLPECHHSRSGIPTRLALMSKEVCAMLRESFESLETEDWLLAQDVQRRLAWVQQLGLESRSRITQVLMMGEHNMPWASACLSVLNGWEEVAACAWDIAKQISVSHQLESTTFDFSSSMQSRSRHAPCSPA